MKKCFLFFVLVIAMIGVLKGSQVAKFTDFAVVDIESLANGESSTGYYKPETKRCKHDLGGGWFESSVERVCVESTTPSSCTPIECGEPW